METSETDTALKRLSPESSAEAHVHLDCVTKSYGKDNVVDGVTLEIKRGEFFSLLGPSGCGKTTTLRMLAGFVEPSAGRIVVSGRDITALAPEHRNIGVVFQDYAIFPHMTVFDNVAFGLRMRKWDKQRVREAVEGALARVDLVGSEAKLRKHLSGGQQQRVALARALVIEPDVLVLDEPLSALDAKLRDQMRYWIRDIQQSLGITTIYVTHDQTEALTMSDRIGVMRSGKVMQIGSPRELYEEPQAVYVASFLGSATLVPGVITDLVGHRVKLLVAGKVVEGRRPLTDGTETPLAVGQSASLVLRPEQLVLRSGEERDSSGQEGQQELICMVQSVGYEGSLMAYHLAVEGLKRPILARVSTRDGEPLFTSGQPARITWPTNTSLVLPGHINF